MTLPARGIDHNQPMLRKDSGEQPRKGPGKRRVRPVKLLQGVQNRPRFQQAGGFVQHPLDLAAQLQTANRRAGPRRRAQL